MILIQKDSDLSKKKIEHYWWYKLHHSWHWAFSNSMRIPCKHWTTSHILLPWEEEMEERSKIQRSKNRWCLSRERNMAKALLRFPLGLHYCTSPVVQCLGSQHCRQMLKSEERPCCINENWTKPFGFMLGFVHYFFLNLNLAARVVSGN